MRAAGRTAFVLAAALVACNSIVGFDDLTLKNKGKSSSTSSSGGSGDDDDAPKDAAAPGTPDSGSSGPRCNPNAPFGAAEIVPELDGAMSTRTAVMTPDELDIYYLRGNSSPFQLRHAKRANRDAKWSEPTSENLSPDATYLMGLAGGGTKLYYWRTGAGADATKNYSAPRAESFGPGTVLMVPSATNRPTWVTKNDDGAYWSDYFTTEAGVVDKVIMRGNITTTGVFAAAQLAGIHNVPGQDEFPVVDGKETKLYFSATRPGGPGAADIHVSTRENNLKPWLAPRLVAELSSPSPEQPTWVSDDDCVIFIDRLAHSMRAVRPK